MEGAVSSWTHQESLAELWHQTLEVSEETEEQIQLLLRMAGATLCLSGSLASADSTAGLGVQEDGSTHCARSENPVFHAFPQPRICCWWTVFASCEINRMACFAASGLQERTLASLKSLGGGRCLEAVGLFCGPCSCGVGSFTSFRE